MIEYFFAVVEIAYLFLWQFKNTYDAWKGESVNVQKYREFVVYWIFFATAQGVLWSYEVNEVNYFRVGILMLVHFKLNYVARVFFSTSKKIKDN